MSSVRPLVVLLALAIASCKGGTSNLEPPAPLASFDPSASVRPLWTFDVGKGAKKKFVPLAPILHGDTLYTADVTGRVSALTVDKGRTLWEVKLGDTVNAPLGFGEGFVLIGTKNGQVIALGPGKGELRWRSSVSSEVLARPVADTGVVVVHTIDGRIFGISAGDGTRLWMQQRTEPSLSLRGTSPPVTSAGMVITGFANGKLLAVNLKTGRIVWERTVAQPHGRNEIERLVDVDAPPLVIGDRVFAVSYQGKLVAMDLATGRIVWARDVSSYTGLAADGDNVYLTDAQGNVLAVHQRTGASVWRQDKLRARLLNAPTLVAGYVAVGDFAGYVHWLSVASGEFAARALVSGGAIRGPALAVGNTLFVQNQGGVLAALRIEPAKAAALAR